MSADSTVSGVARAASSAVEVVLATWNGARFLPEQVGSLCQQRHPISRVLVGDDGSVDGAPAVLRQCWPGDAAVALVELPPSRRLGPAANFSRLLSATTAELVLLSDQDDVWSLDKVSRLLAAAQGVGIERGCDHPLLVVHDLSLIDADGQLIAPSFWRHQRFNPEHGRRFGTLLTMNSFPGCAMLANRALLRLALPIPAAAIMHDWWLALVAAACGSIVVVDEPLVQYRQHPGNAVGASDQGFVGRLRAGQWGAVGLRQRAWRLAVAQARELRRRRLPLSQAAQRQLRVFASLPFRRSTGRVLSLVRHRIGKTGLLRHLGFLASL